MTQSWSSGQNATDGAQADLYDFNPPLNPPPRSTQAGSTRRRPSLGGFNAAMHSYRAAIRDNGSAVNTDTDNPPPKRHHGPSQSFSSPRPNHINGLRASYNAVKANAKQKIQTMASSKKRAASHGTHEVPVLQRTRSIFGLRPTTSATSSRAPGDRTAAVEEYNNVPGSSLQAAQWPNVPGAAARQSARDFGKSSVPRLSRDDSAFGEHRRQCSHHRESGISLAAELENLRIGSASRADSLPDIPRQDPCKVLPDEISYSILSFLNLNELVVCEQVSQQWRRISLDANLRRQEFMRTWAPKREDGAAMPGVGGQGIGRPNGWHQNWTKMYRARQEMERRWRAGPYNIQTTATYLNGHTDSVYCVHFDEDKIITGSRDRTFRIWDVKSGELRMTVGVPGAGDNDKRHGHRIAAQDALSGPMRVLNRFGSARGTYHTPIFYHDASILCLLFDDELLVTGSSDHSLIMWDIHTFQPIRRLSQHTAGVLDIAFDKQKIVSCSKDGTICVWDRITGKLLIILVGHRGPVNAVQMRGNLIVTASGEGCAKLWKIDPSNLGTPEAEVQGRCLKEFRSKDRGLACVEFSADGRFVLAGGNDKVIYKFDAGTGALVEVYKGHKGLVRSLYLDQPSKRIVTGSYDNELKCWDYVGDGVSGGTGRERERWGLSQWATSWILSAKSDYRRLVTTSQDGRALLVDFGAGVPGAGLLEGAR